MNLVKLSWKYLTYRPLSTGLNLLLLAFGLSIITVLLLVQDQLEKKITQDAAGIDLVVGAKGSPLQLILSSVYHVDFPTGNINMEEAMRISRSRLIKQVIPLALGDNVQGLRVVGTNHDFLSLNQVEFASGKPWEYPFEVILGAESARILKLQLGDTFLGSHGISVGSHEHEQHPFKVTGILAPTGKGIDRLVLTSIESLWYTHEEADSIPTSSIDLPVSTHGFPPSGQDREVTSLLIQFRNPMGAIQLPRMINSGTSMQAASPAFEMARLFELLGIGVKVLQGLAIVVILIAGLGIFIALYNSLKERKYDLALLRALGASRMQLVALVVMESILLTTLGAGLGLLMGHGLLAVLVAFTTQEAFSVLQP
ncbi:MAG: FtsX-like permease family protein, partial [Cyclobacteriaceae bacterium]|nr:FtsX-like permease family protein [Cyclobacteriaceae bacterium]